jgi:putative SOS response-associated peptidase YedK
MCYEVSQLKANIAKAGKRKGNTPEQILATLEQLDRQLTGDPLFHVSGFEHPVLHLITSNGHLKVETMKWGLVPLFIKDKTEAEKISNITLNARGESIFEKRSFKNAAKHHRAILPLTGFFEYLHKGKKTFPHFITTKSGEPLMVAAIWDQWKEAGSSTNAQKTFSIVTCQANNLLAKIHNNPKQDGPRMPLILSGDALELWLANDADEKDIDELIQPAPDDDMKAYTVRALRGKNSVGNTAIALEPFSYAELNEQTTLF